MRELTYSGPGRLAWHEIEDPKVTPGGALVRPLAVARCDLDPALVQFGLFPGSFPVGHEVVAQVVEVGPEVARVKVGETVLVPFQVSCGACPACRREHYAACETYAAPAGASFGFGEAGGGHGGAVADLLAVPAADHMLVAAPGGVSPAALAVLPDNVVDAYRSVGPPLAREPGADVLIIGGAGQSIGLYASALALALGAGSVRYVDRDPLRCAAAERLGADVTRHDGDWPRRFERAAITVENTAEPDGLRCAVQSTEAYGTCTSVAIHFGGAVELPLLSMYTRGITLEVGRCDSRRHVETVLALVTEGRFDPLAVETTLVGWDEALERWLEPAIKLVVSD